MSQTPTRPPGLQHLAKMINDQAVAMLTTIDEDGTLRSRPMISRNRQFNGHDLWFFTKASDPKSRELEKHRNVNVTYASHPDYNYVSISGTGELVFDREKMNELWDAALDAWFPGGLQEPDLALLQVHVQKAEFWDASSSRMVQLFGFVSPTGRRPPQKVDEHAKLDMRRLH